MSRRSPLVQPLADAMRVPSPPLLQALVSRFHLEGCRDGAHLALALDDHTPAVTRREGKAAARPSGPDADRVTADCQRRIDAVLDGDEPSVLVHDDPGLPFRHANGGALPFVELDGRRSVVLFYRDIFPRGWNIANGASDAATELLEPAAVIARELGEELMFGLPGESLGRCAGAALRGPAWPPGTPAHDFWTARLGFDPLAAGTVDLHVDWSDGPDSLTVRAMLAGVAYRCVTRRCRLTLTARDQGLEVDRIAGIALPSGAVPVDGEVNRGVAVDRPIGLFDPESLAAGLREGATDFRPGRLFHGGREVDPSDLETVVRRDMLPRLEDAGLRSPAESDDLREGAFVRDLCPVTRHLLRRHLDIRDPSARSRP